MAYIPSSGSVVAFQSDPTKLQASVTGRVDIGNLPVTQNISGSVFATGSVTALQGTNPWTVQLTSGSVITAGGNSSVQVNNIVTGNSSVYLIPGVGVLGSVATLQGTNPWIVQLTSGSVITAGGNSSVQVNNIVTGNSSVYLIPGVGVLGSVATLQGTNPWVIGNSSVMITGIVPAHSVSGVGTFNIDPQGGGSIIAKLINSSVTAYQGATPWLANGSVVANNILTGNSSVQVISGIGVIGSVAVLQGTNPWIVGNSSVQVNNIVTGQSSVYLIPGVGVLGSVATLQGTNPWVVITPGSVVTVWKDSSVLAGLVSTNASIVTVNQATSIVGTYAEDSAHTTADKGLFVLQVRNDTMSSITSADSDYSPQAVGPVGEVLIANAPITKWISGQACVFSGSSVQVIAAQGASIFTYITGIQIANDSAVTSRVKITSGNGSTLAFTIAPANGGSNIIFANGLRTGENQGVSASVSGVTPSVYVTLTGFIAKI